MFPTQGFTKLLTSTHNYLSLCHLSLSSMVSEPQYHPSLSRSMVNASHCHLSESSLVHLIVIWVIIAQRLVHLTAIWVKLARWLVHLTVVHLKDLISLWDSEIFWVWIKLSWKPKPNPLFTDEREPHLLIIILLLLIIIIKESILLYHHPITVKLNVVLHVT